MEIYIDIGLGAIFVIALTVGVVRGFTKQFFRPLVGILSIIGAVALVSLLYPLFANSPLMITFVNTAAGWFGKPLYSTEVTDADALRQVISGSYLSILSSSADNFFSRMQNVLDGSGLPITIGNFFGKIIVNLIVELLMWLALYIAIKYLLKGIRYLLEKITRVAVFKTIDKVLGGIWAIAVTYFIVVGILLTLIEIIIVRFAPGMQQSLTSIIGDATILKFLHNTNVVGSFLASLLGTELPVV